MSEGKRNIVSDDATILRLAAEARKDPWANNDAVIRNRLRRQGQRPLGVNLSEALEMSRFAAALKLKSAVSPTRFNRDHLELRRYRTRDD